MIPNSLHVTYPVHWGWVFAGNQPESRSQLPEVGFEEEGFFFQRGARNRVTLNF